MVIVLLLLTSTESVANNPDPIEIKVECMGSHGCIFSGTDIPLKITLTNTSPDTIAVAIDFLRKKGPNIKLTDVKSLQSRRLRVSKPPYSLSEKFDELTPQGSIELTTTISTDDITSFRTELIEIDVEVIVAVKLKPQFEDAVLVSAPAKFTIRGKDTDELIGKMPKIL